MSAPVVGPIELAALELVNLGIDPSALYGDSTLAWKAADALAQRHNLRFIVAAQMVELVSDRYRP